MARLLADENFPLSTTAALRLLGHEVMTADEAGLANRSTPDDEVLQFARTERLALLTLNRRDFIRLHARSADHPGIVICNFDADFSGQAARIHMLIEAEGPLDGKLLRVHRPA